jgi:Putative Na+/H+ antiporter
MYFFKSFLFAQVSQPCDFSKVAKPAGVLKLEAFEFSDFHLVTLIIFILAIFHTLSANRITSYAHKLDRIHKAKLKKLGKDPKEEVSFIAEMTLFLGEVEVIFALWIIPLFLITVWFYGWNTALEYLDTRDFTESLFVVVIMSLAATKPIVEIAEKFLKILSNLVGGTISSWWLIILTIGPLLGSLVTEAGAMTLSATLLSRKFYDYKPSLKLAYATIGLLFVNISVGGVLTNFAAPPVLVVARCWDWSSFFMLTEFGWKAALGIILANVSYWFLFKKELQEMESQKQILEMTESTQTPKHIPFWITLIHIIFIFWIVLNSHYPAVFIGSFLMYLGFHKATRPHQYVNGIKRPLLVGLFLAGLIIHGGLQGWWIVPLMEKLGHTAVMVVGVILTAFNDNAAISYLTSLIPNWGDDFKYAIISGVVTGGGLTVIANAPNPAGFVILNKHFSGGISAVRLFLAAIFPTILFFILFYLPFFLGFKG